MRLRVLGSIPRQANVLAGASLLLLVVKLVILDHIPEAFPDAHDLGLVVEAILASVVASYVFFLVVVHFKQSSDRARVEPYVKKHVDRVVGSCLSQLNAISSESGVKLDLAKISAADVNAAFAKLAPFGEAPMVYFPGNAKANWLQYFEHSCHGRNSAFSVSSLSYLSLKPN
jgi:hypothetical protein